MRSANGATYCGGWDDNKRSGYGTYTDANGEVYQGKFYLSQFHGDGTYTFTDGASYVGHYQGDKIQGRGVYKSASGATLEVDVKEDNMFQVAEAAVSYEANQEGFEAALHASAGGGHGPNEEKGNPSAGESGSGSLFTPNDDTPQIIVACASGDSSIQHSHLSGRRSDAGTRALEAGKVRSGEAKLLHAQEVRTLLLHLPGRSSRLPSCPVWSPVSVLGAVQGPCGTQGEVSSV